MNENKREIKFRAWDKKNEKMIYLNLYQAVHYKEDFILRQNDWGDGNWIDDHCGNVEWDLMQYTGLKDKNGKEIFEGDILKLGNEPNYQVIWGNGCWIGKEINGWDPMADFFPIGLQENKGEIIGNIYENPDLIKLI